MIKSNLGLTRRAVTLLLGAAPALGRAVLTSQGGGGYPPSILQDVVRDAGMKAGISTASEAVQARPPLQLMSHAQAVAKLMADPMLRAEAERHAWQNHRIVYSLDDDLAAMRSFSHMAKITFQRQRNVERELREAMQPPPWEARGIFERAIRKFMWGE